MNNLHQVSVTDICRTLRVSHQNRQLYPLHVRRNHLSNLLLAIKNYEEKINEALYQDLKRPQFETFMLESSLIKEEIKCALNNLSAWNKKQPVATPIQFQPGTSYVKPTPKGLVLIIAPWNYPLQLSLIPLVSAIAAGNCAVIKPSELAPHSAAVIKEIVEHHLDPDCYRVILGDHHVTNELLDLPFDHIFYTGNAQAGKIVMKKAAEHLTPVTLELGGKSPAIIDEKVDITIAAKRIVWAKFLNAGQTCIAPDYLLVHKKIVDEFQIELIAQLHALYGHHVQQNKDFGRIINKRHFGRLKAYLSEGRIVHGGDFNEESLFIEPTVLVDVKPDALILKEEIFGPILPIVPIDSIDKGIDHINSCAHPLALYIFSKNDATISKIIYHTHSGGVCINDCLSQAAITGLPFGGIGRSGFGNYHGHYGFLTFSHLRAIHKRATILDNPLRYAPYSEDKTKFARLLL